MIEKAYRTVCYFCASLFANYKFQNSPSDLLVAKTFFLRIIILVAVGDSALYLGLLGWFVFELAGK
ncbi:hypothetical protein Pint_16059 [Pistacia integerrima]|uniref:Uncharacterized protein n=1 Tax=Pistacia integerrima TaxID=434235 RepID=A0ACC0ZAP2_9ROSI|nr:hypothetical protein Pint_16059 [Pistacia integerrima]